jgi:hypothetical protein
MGLSMYGLVPPILFLSHLVTTRMIIAEIGCLVANWNVIAPTVGRTMTAAIVKFMEKR